MTTNLDVLRPSRSKPRAGDVFALRQLGGDFRFGRVISTDAMAGWSMPGATLIYIFRFSSSELAMPEQDLLAANDLLIAPLMTNRLPWSRGYFQTIDHRALAAGRCSLNTAFAAPMVATSMKAPTRCEALPSHAEIGACTATAPSTTRSAVPSEFQELPTTPGNPIKITHDRCATSEPLGASPARPVGGLRRLGPRPGLDGDRD